VGTCSSAESTYVSSVYSSSAMKNKHYVPPKRLHISARLHITEGNKFHVEIGLIVLTSSVLI